MDSSPTEANPRGLDQRKNKACRECHLRKVKCDGLPCSNCRKARITCQVLQRRSRKRRISTGTSLRLRGLNIVTTQLGSRNTNDGLNDASNASHLDSVEEADLNSPSEYAVVEGDAELATQHLDNFFRQKTFDQPICARLIYVGGKLSNLNFLIRKKSKDVQKRHFSCASYRMPRAPQQLLSQPTTNSLLQDTFILPSKSVSDALVMAYFERFHASCPIIDKCKFLELYNDPDSAPPLLLLQAVYLAGSHVTTSVDNAQQLKATLFQRVKTLFENRYEQDRMHMVQAALLLTMFSDGGDDICANAWWWINAAASIAVGLGMHRDVGTSNMPDDDKRCWRRIWWILVQFDLQVSLCYGRPQHINLDDCDTPQLCLNDFLPSSDVEYMTAMICIHHTTLCALTSRILRNHFCLKATSAQLDWTYAFRQVDTAFSDWRISASKAFNEHDRYTNPAEVKALALLMDLTYQTALLQVHRLQTVAAPDSRSSGSQHDSHICAEASTTIIRIFEQLHELSAIQICNFWASHALFTAMIYTEDQIHHDNPVVALRAVEHYESGLASLRRLSSYWLSAASIERLCQNKIAELRRKTAERQNAAARQTIRPHEGQTVAPSGDSLEESVGGQESSCNSHIGAHDKFIGQVNTQLLDADHTEANGIGGDLFRNDDSEWIADNWYELLASFSSTQ